MRIAFFLAIVIMLAACTPAGSPTAAAPSTPVSTSVDMRPYQTPTGSDTPAPGDAVSTPAQLPSLTPTPRLHKIKANETLLSLALKYGTTLDALLAANPGISPNMLSVGQELVIPPPNVQVQPGAANPTPVSLGLGQVFCYPDSTGGAWCFVVVQNGAGQNAVESVILRLRVAAADGGQVLEQTVPALLNRIEPGTALPVAAYFAPPLPLELQTGVDLVSSLPTTQGDGRFLPVRLENISIHIQPGGLSAEVSGEVWLAGEGQTPANLVWVAAAAYDASAYPVGVRRWESSAQLSPGQALPFRFQVYSAGGEITRVDVLVEARP
jgi:LysM repeat protein